MNEPKQFTLDLTLPCCGKLHSPTIQHRDVMKLTTCNYCQTRFALIPADNDTFNIYQFHKVGAVNLPSSVKEKKQLYRFFS